MVELGSYFLNFAHMSLIDFLTEEIAFPSSPNQIQLCQNQDWNLEESEKFPIAALLPRKYFAPFLYHQSSTLSTFSLILHTYTFIH